MNPGLGSSFVYHLFVLDATKIHKLLLLVVCS
jgi:hypothetical protein